MKILVYKWVAYNYRDIIETLKQMGHTVDTIEYKLTCYDEDENFAQILSEKLRSEKYDFVFTVNYYGVISDVCEREDILYFSWSCDSPLISMYHESLYNSCNRIFLFDMADVARFKAMGAEHVYYLPLCVDARRLQYLIERRPHPGIYQSDISFVGSLYEKNTYDRLVSKMSDYLIGYFDGAMTAQMAISGVNVLDEFFTPDIIEQVEEIFHLEKTERSFSNLSLIFRTTVLGFKIARTVRKKALIELGKTNQVSLYTGSNMEDLVGVDYRGGLDYWSEMPIAFYESKINLNFTIPNIESGLPLRIWDILGSGGFLMTNYQAEIPMYFEEGKDLVCFDGIDELKDKCAYYLSHEDERIQIARKGLEKVICEHSYTERLKKIICEI